MRNRRIGGVESHKDPKDQTSTNRARSSDANHRDNARLGATQVSARIAKAKSRKVGSRQKANQRRARKSISMHMRINLNDEKRKEGKKQ